ncbi:translation initiation factor IF-2 [Triticum aestivum]|uniref:translation initiation factor IF-2 n=2 Tax=Triticum TaxID=4564 RepID=UPI001D030DA3|nr:translation initiation factor IF-2-like [Triticum aestivum]
MPPTFAAINEVLDRTKEGIGAKGVDFAVAAALAKGLPRFQLTTSNSQPLEPKDSTKRDAGHRNQKGIEQIGQDGAGLLHKTPMRSARRPPRRDPRPLPPCYPRSQEDSHPAPTGATCRGMHAEHTIRGCPPEKKQQRTPRRPLAPPARPRPLAPAPPPPPFALSRSSPLLPSLPPLLHSSGAARHALRRGIPFVAGAAVEPVHRAQAAAGAALRRRIPFAAARRSPSRRPGAALRRGPQVAEPPPPPFDAARRFPSRQRTPPRPPAAPEPQCDGPKPEIHNTGGLSRRGFPAGFVFGTAASAYQVEGMARQGGRRPSIWDAFAAIPGTIAGNGTADVTVDEYHRYKEDVSIMKEMGFDAYRFSISWWRIFPDGTGKVNQEGVDHYNRLIDYMLQQDN